MTGGYIRAAVLAGAVWAALALPAWATEPVVYDRAYFDSFAPQTAEDMVDVIPGFTIRDDDRGERGFGQANSNILVNGRRPSSKTLDADDVLARISADRVVRIEIVDGTTLDIPGLSGDVANIVTETFGITGNWEYSARFEEGTEPQLLEGEGSVSIARGNTTLTLSADIGQFTYTEDGQERFFDGDGVLFEDRVERLVFENQDPQFDAAFNWTPDNGSVLNLTGNIQFQNRNFDIRESFAAVGPGGTDGQSLVFSGEDEIEYELGGDYEFDLDALGSDGRLKLIGLYRFEDSEFINRSSVFQAGVAPASAEFLQDVVETETIARAEYIWDAGAWQLASEYAFNSLEADSEFDGASLPFVEVNEDRVQAAVSHNRKLGAWDLQASLGAEYSKIDVPSNALSEAREFVRPKGFVSGSRDLDSKHSLVLRVDRQVGQLNFFDFVSDIDLEEGRDDRGNTRIVPDQTWLLQATFERTDPKGLSWRITPELGIVEDPIDRIRFADGAEGPGNLESNSYFYGVLGNFTYILDDVAKGLRLSGNGSLVETDIEDPLTGERRRINGAALWSGQLVLRHDIANTPYAYQVDVRQNASDVRVVRFGDIIEADFPDPRLILSVEHKDFLGMNLRVTLADVLNRDLIRERQLFDGDRLGPLIRREEQVRNRGRRLSIELSDTF